MLIIALSSNVIMASVGFMSLDGWKGIWNRVAEGAAIPWHVKSVDRDLKTHIDLLTDGETGLSILVPLCGKSLDLKWLADNGYKAFGIDISQRAVSEIFTDAGLSAKVTPIGSDSTLYEACDGRLKVLAGDVFSINNDICGHFDCVWSKHSFGSINPVDRDRYVNVIYSLLKPQGRILMCNLFYDQSERKGPPFSISSDLVKLHYGNRFNIEFMRSDEFTELEIDFVSSVERQLHFLRKIV